MKNRLLIFCLTVCIVVCTFAFFGGCSALEIPPPEHSAEEETQADIISNTGRLNITAQVSVGENTTIPADYFGGNYYDDIYYSGLKDVTIHLDNQSYKLEDAIRDGLITVEEIIAYAQIDARNELCTVDHQTYNGVTEFIYRYPAYQLETVHDIYELPNGDMYFIKRVSFHNVTYTKNPFIFGIRDENGRIDQEDWGVTFTPVKASSSGLTLKTTQSAGQQIGTLYIEQYALYSSEVEEYLTTQQDNDFLARLETGIDLAMDAEGEITLDWSETFGSLSSGNYILRLTIGDRYDPELVHPLMKNYWDYQAYYIEFTIK